MRHHAPRRAASRHHTIEPLEHRRLFASAFANVDISTRAGNEAEGAIAIDRTNPQRLFAFSNLAGSDAGLFAATSNDGGLTWSARRVLAPDGDVLPPACCDPTAAFDAFGNLFIAYLNNDRNVTEVAISTDAGQTFAPLATLGADTDQPTIAAGAGAVWVTFTEGNKIGLVGAAVGGLGSVGAFGDVAIAPGSKGGAFGDVAIGPAGEVAVTWQRGGGGQRPVVGVNVDPDGLGPAPLGPRVAATTTGVRLFDIVPAQPERKIDAEAGLAFDRTAGPRRGRLYLLYTDVAAGSSRDRNNTDLFVRYSDDLGATWGNPLRVNDDAGTATQMLPRMAVDQTSGDLAFTWYDTRDDQVPGAPDDTDGKVDTDVVFYGALAKPTAEGLLLSANVRLAAGSSNATASDNGVELGDYTGLDFHAGIVRPIWADNSDSTGDNPDGPRAALDLYTAVVAAADLPAPTRAGVGGSPVAGRGPAAALVAKDYPATRRRAPLKLTIGYSADDGVEAASLGDDDLRITGPNGYDAPASLARVRRVRGRPGAFTATYLVGGPTGTWTAADDGVYSILLRPDAVLDSAGRGSPGGETGSFVVSLA